MGLTVQDRITGFKGVVTGRAQYVTGCEQALVQPPIKADGGDFVEGRWFDEDRLVVVDVAVLEDFGRTAPGGDKPAPIK